MSNRQERDEFFYRLEEIKKNIRELPLDVFAHFLAKEEPKLADSLAFHLSTELMEANNE
jgi:hypothetical protein